MTCRSVPTSRTGGGTRGLAIPKSNWAVALENPPFEAYAVTCGMTFTFGGLKVTTEAQVLDTQQQSSRGYTPRARCSAGLFYFNYPGATGLMSGAVFGRIAGRSAAKAAIGSGAAANVA